MKSLLIQTAVCSCTSAVLIAAKHPVPSREEKNPEHRRLNHLPTRLPARRPTFKPSSKPKSPTSLKPTRRPTFKPSSKPTTSNPTTMKPTFKPSSQKPITKSPTSLKPTSLKPTTLQPTTSNPTTMKPTFKPSSQKPITKTPTTLKPTSLKPTTLQPTATPSMAPTEIPSESLRTVVPTSSGPTTGLPTITNVFSPTTSKPSFKPSSRMPSTSKPTSSSSKPSSTKPTSKTPTTFMPLSQRPTTNKPVGSSPSSPTIATSKQPTIQPTTSTPTQVPQPASWPTARLKIYWQTDFKWQDFTSDPLYCMDCWDNDCQADDFIKIARCSTSQDQLFSAIDGTIRPALNTSLCFTTMGYAGALDTDGRTISTPIQLQPCLENTWDQPVMNQTFLSKPRVGDGFDLIPMNNNRRCLAQLHHPKSGEKVFPRSCVEARIDTTGSWVTY